MIEINSWCSNGSVITLTLWTNRLGPVCQEFWVAAGIRLLQMFTLNR